MTELPKLKEPIFVDVKVTEQNLEDGIFEIYSELFPDVKREDLVFEELQGGFVNSIQKVYLKGKSSDDGLIFRSFGFKIDSSKLNETMKKMSIAKQTEGDKNTDENQNDKTAIPPDFDLEASFFNRVSEYKVMNEISKYGLSQPVYARYSNGVCYGYSPGNTVNGEIMLTEEFLKEFTTKYALFNSIKYEIPGAMFKTHFDRLETHFKPMIVNMVAMIDDAIAKIPEFPYNEFPTMSSIMDTENKIMDYLNKIGMGRICFSHCDLNQRNMIWNDETKKLLFIDFEMVLPQYVIFEIGQLFFCYCGHFFVNFNPKLFPDEDYRRRFLRSYLAEYNKLNDIKLTDEQLEAEVEKMFIQTNLTSLLFFLRGISMGISLDFNPDFLNNDELKKARESVKYFGGRYGLQIAKFVQEIKDKVFKDADDYLKSIEK